MTAAATVAQAVLFQPEQAWGQRRAADKQRKACQITVGRHRDRPALTRMGYSRRPRPWRTDKCYHGSIVHVAFGTIRPPNGLSFPQAGAVSLRTNEGKPPKWTLAANQCGGSEVLFTFAAAPVVAAEIANFGFGTLEAYRFRLNQNRL